ncbi:hypothetical protein OTU49_017261 [Cherax quadricarinatus]|uniref:C3H1-type domain-containing protein n=1 Tax=Cherax quadricarinatus TaxID=27406 RepID=A0AAW0XP08_CHEQU
MDMKSLGIPGKKHITCKFWINGRCRRLPHVCPYIHSYYCPDSIKCKKLTCTLLHIDWPGIKLPPQKNKTAEHAVLKKQSAIHKRKKHHKTSIPQSERSSDSSPWHFNSAGVKDNSPPLEDFDEELCQGLEEVGLELDRFAEEVSENRKCEDEAINLTKHHSDESSPDTVSPYNNSLFKCGKDSETTYKLSRNSQKVTSTNETFSHSGGLVQRQRPEKTEETAKVLQNVILKSPNETVKLKSHKDVMQLEKQVQQVFTNSKAQAVPVTSLEPPLAVESNNLNVNNHSEEENYLGLSSNSHTLQHSSVDRREHVDVKTRTLDETVSHSAGDTKETENSTYVSTISEELNKVLQELKCRDTNKPTSKILNNHCLSQNINALSKEGWPVMGSHSLSPAKLYETLRSVGDECRDEVYTLKALLSQKKQLVNQVKIFIKQKNDISAKRDLIMSNFSGDTAKFSQILKEYSQLSKKISSYIVKVNAQIKFTNQKISDLENKIKTTILREWDTNAEWEISSEKSVQGDQEYCDTNKSMFKSEKVKREELSNEQNIFVGLENVKSPDEQRIRIFNGHEENLNIQKHKPKKAAFKQNDKAEMVRVPPIEHMKRETNKSCSSERERSQKEQYKQTLYTSSVENNHTECNKQMSRDVCKFEKNPHQKSQDNAVNKEKMSDLSKDLSTHWCKLCNVFFTNVYGFVKHLESLAHMSKLKDGSINPRKQETPQKESKKKPEINEGHQKTVGVEFLHSTKVFFCELCDSIFWNTDDAVLHPQSARHVQKYKEYVLKNTDQEMNFLRSKMSAFTEYCRERRARSKSISTLKEGKRGDSTGECAQKQAEDCTKEKSILKESELSISVNLEECKKRKSASLDVNKNSYFTSKKSKVLTGDIAKSVTLDRQNSSEGSVNATKNNRSYCKSENSIEMPYEVFQQKSVSLSEDDGFSRSESHQSNPDGVWTLANSCKNESLDNEKIPTKTDIGMAVFTKEITEVLEISLRSKMTKGVL